MSARQNNEGDLAATRCVQTIPDGDYNFDVEIEAVQDGIEIGIGGLFISWEWIGRARAALFLPDFQNDERHQS
jgi:hypothetical protein